MNLDELRSVQNAERNRGGLQPLRESFYEEVGRYIADLKAERDRVADRADDPWSSPEVKRLTDEIETAEEVVEAIYERRMGKILERASLAAAEMSADEEGLTAEERALFSDLVERIRENKQTVLDVLDVDSAAGPTEERETTGDAGATGKTGATGDAEPREASGPSRTRVDPDPPPGAEAGTDARHRETAGHGDAEPRADDLSTADAMGAGPDRRADAGATAGSTPGDGGASPDDARDDAGTTPDDARGDAGAFSGDASRGDAGASRDEGAAAGGAATGGERQDATDRVTVRITRDVGPILGIDDRQYVLEPEDVVELPAENAVPLVERDAAQKLE